MTEVGRPAGGLSSAKMTAVALEEQAFQSPVHVVIDLPKLDGGITCAEVRAPATQHRIEARDGVAHTPVTHGAEREPLHALADPLHRARGRPPLKEVHPSVLLLPQGIRQRR